MFGPAGMPGPVVERLNGVFLEALESPEAQAYLEKNGALTKGGTVTLDITTDSVGLAPFYDHQNLITADIQAKIDAAIKGLKDGSIDPCKPNAFV